MRFKEIKSLFSGKSALVSREKVRQLLGQSDQERDSKKMFGEVGVGSSVKKVQDFLEVESWTIGGDIIVIDNYGDRLQIGLWRKSSTEQSERGGGGTYSSLKIGNEESILKLIEGFDVELKQ